MRFDSFLDNKTDESISKVGKNIVKKSINDAKLIRLSIMEELKAINDYIERAEKCENDVVRKVLFDIAEEERVHFGELEMMLEAVDPSHETSEDEAEDEIEDMFGDFDDMEDENEND